MDFKPADFNPASPGLAAGEVNIGPTNFAMPGFGWDETHGQQARPGVFFPNVAGSAPEDPGNRAFVFLFGPNGQTNSTFTSTTTPGSTFPAAGINPTLPANAGLGFSWSQHLETTAGGNPVNVRFAVQTASGNWYASNAGFPTGTVGVGSQGNYDPQSLLYNPARANWRDLTLGATPAEGVTIGGSAGRRFDGQHHGHRLRRGISRAVDRPHRFRGRWHTTRARRCNWRPDGVACRLQHHQGQFRHERGDTKPGRCHRRRGCQSVRLRPVEGQFSISGKRSNGAGQVPEPTSTVVARLRSSAGLGHAAVAEEELIAPVDMSCRHSRRSLPECDRNVPESHALICKCVDKLPLR